MRPSFAPLLIAALFTAACGTATASQQCDETTPCDDGEACNLATNQCETATDACTDSTECAGAAPYCIVGTDDLTVCSATCDDDPVCGEVDPSAPYCDADACHVCSPRANAGCGFDSTTPICDEADYTCRGCTEHAECISQTCLPDGSCADADTVAYVSPTGSGDCTSPAGACNITKAVAELGGARTIIRLLPGTHVPSTAEPLVITHGTTMLGGPEPTEIFRDTGVPGPVITIIGPAAVVMDQVSVRGGVGAGQGDGITCSAATLAYSGGSISGTAGNGIEAANCALTVRDAELVDNPGAGIAASGSAPMFAERTTIDRNTTGVSFGGPTTLQDCRIADNAGTGISSVFAGVPLTVTRAVIRDNGGRAIAMRGDLDLSASTIATNHEGVVTAEASATHHVVNNLFFGNGDATTNVGALSLRGTASSDIEFNTIVANTARTDLELGGAGMICGLAIDDHALFAPNNIIWGNNAGMAVPQVASNCTTTGSYVAAFSNGNPLAFANPAAEDYHLTALSTLVIGQGTGATTTTDFEGDPRDGSPDLGADEYVAE